MIFPATAEHIHRAAQALRAGSLAAFPTETVYGLGADAFNVEALARVFDIKNRPRFDPLIIHIAREDSLSRLVCLSRLSAENRERLQRLCAAFWPGPLTLVLPKLPCVPDLATAGLDSVAIRLPAHETARALILQSTGALAAPSANPFGYLSPTRAEHVERQLGGKVDIILDGGPARIGVESTVLDLTTDTPRILRDGGIPREEIEALTGCEAGVQPQARPASPGQMDSHYAPRKPLSLFERGRLPERLDSGTAYLFFNGAEHRDLKGGHIFFLSEQGDLHEAAARLFELLHRADTEHWQAVAAEKAPDTGLGRAINDRLRRASVRLPDKSLPPVL